MLLALNAFRAAEIPQWIKVHAAMHGSLELILGTHIVEGER